MRRAVLRCAMHLVGFGNGVALDGFALEFYGFEQRSVIADATFAAADGVLEGEEVGEIRGAEAGDAKIR